MICVGGSWIVPKMQAHWSTEPVFAGVMQAFQKLLGGQLQNFAQNPNAVLWPIADGDMPSPTGKTSEFAKGHWLISASTGNPPNVELVQAGATAPVKLHSRVGVKPGDYCMLGVTAAVKQNQANGVKFYLNACVFTHPGEEIVFANSVSGAELMRQAQAQGLSSVHVGQEKERLCVTLAVTGVHGSVDLDIVNGSITATGLTANARLDSVNGSLRAEFASLAGVTEDLPRYQDETGYHFDQAALRTRLATRRLRTAAGTTLWLLDDYGDDDGDKFNADFAG